MRKMFETKLFKYGFLGMLYVAAICIAAVLFGSDFAQFMGWLLTLVAAGIIFFPVAFLMFRKFRDCGILFSITLGVAFMSWLSWLFSSIGFIPFNVWGSVIVWLVCALANIGFLVAVKRIKGSIIPKDYNFSEKIIPMLITGLVFLVTFITWNYIRGFKPQALGSTECVMDYAFMKSLDRSNYMPATDMWMSGKGINYYYVGQYVATFLSKISGVGVGYGYNFMLMTEASLALAIPYSLVSTVFSEFTASKGILRKASSHAAGLISGIAVSICGNFHYIIFNYVVPPLRDMLGVTSMAKENNLSLPNYFFPNSTRYIGYMPSTTDKTIHEFPAYSFVLGDLHAHVINVMFALCVVGVLYAYVINRKDRIKLAASGAMPLADKNRADSLFGIERFFAKVFDPCVVVVAFFVGLFHTTNYWDYPIYFVVAGAVILYVNFTSEGARYTGLVLTVFHAAIVIIISKLVCLPFTLSFDQISSDIAAVTERTPLYQFLVLWGFPFLVAVVFIVVVVKNFLSTDKARREITVGAKDIEVSDIITPEAALSGHKAEAAPAGKAKEKKKCWIARFLLGVHPSDIFVVIIVCCAMGLCFIPELIYVKDIYSGDYKRANTMFKLTYQAFMLFGVSFGYIFARLLIFGKKKARVFGAICLCLLLLCAGYTKLAVDAWYFTADRTFTTLSATDFLEDGTNGEYEAILYLDKNVRGRPVIMEADGNSYTDACRFSAWTGLPTVLGWNTHEWLWRSSSDLSYPAILSERKADVQTFYTTTDMSEMRKIINKHNISYIIIGTVERSRFGEELQENLLTQLGDEFYSNDSVKIIKVN
ncbi:MAG: hypothetical protein J5739_08680 [Lachnospiraceae bacterium]|nr:hypothetical protein [Lachnospiraceae bacterium]